MATIAKFYLHDAATSNTGTMPSGVLVQGGTTASTGDAAGARTARATDDVIGAANPDTESTLTSNADTLTQRWGHRRFVSAPLAATTFAAADGNWTFSYARSESNLNHNQSIELTVYIWRPSTGLQIGSAIVVFNTGTEPTVAAAEETESLTAAWSLTQAILDGDILVFDVTTVFLQGMATAYTEQFAYDGTTEASTTTCASFVTPPAALTLFTASAAETSAPSQTPLTMMLNQFRPFWLPKLGFRLPDPSFPVAAAVEVERPIQIYGQGVNRSSVY